EAIGQETRARATTVATAVIVDQHTAFQAALVDAATAAAAQSADVIRQNTVEQRALIRAAARLRGVVAENTIGQRGAVGSATRRRGIPPQPAIPRRAARDATAAAGRRIAVHDAIIE